MSSYTEVEIEEAIVDVLDDVVSNGREITYSDRLEEKHAEPSPLMIAGEILQALRGKKEKSA